MSLDALLTQAGIPPDEVLELLPDTDEPPKTPEEKKAEALKSAAALADLPGMPGFLKPTRTSLAADAAKASEEERQQKVAEEGVTTTTVDATGNNGQGFKVTVMVSPDDETSKEAAALRDAASASKPEPDLSGSSHGRTSGLDERFYPQNQAAGSGFGCATPSAPFSSPLAGAPLGDPYGFDAEPPLPFDGGAAMPLGPQPEFPGVLPVPGANAPGVMPVGGGGIGVPGAIAYDMGVAADGAFAPAAGGFGPLDPGARAALGGEGFGLPTDGVPLTDEEAAARAAAAQAAQNAAMVEAMVQYGPDAISEEDKKRFFGKKKREKAAKKAAEEAAAFAAATAAAAAEAAAAEEAARRQPTAYVPTPAPLGGAPTMDGFEGRSPFDGMAPVDAMGTSQIPLGAQQPIAPMDGLSQPIMGQAAADTSGYDRFASPLPENAVYGASPMQPGMADPSVTTGMPAVGAVMGPDGSYLTDPLGMTLGCDQYGYGPEVPGGNPEGVAALEAMRSEMNDASDSHRKRMRTIKIAVGSVVGALALAAITCGILIGTNVISLDDLGIHIGNESSQSNGASSSSSSNGLSYHSSSSRSSSSSSASGSSSSSNASDASSAPGSSDASSSSPSASGGSTTPFDPSSLAGDEVYHYTLTTIDGETPSVTEVVTYNSEGICIQTAMHAVFSTATGAQAFVDRVRSDYGKNFLSGSVDGTTAHVVVDMERAKFTREKYEDALRSVVDDLEIERMA